MTRTSTLLPLPGRSGASPQQPQEDGVEVDRMSRLRGLVPEKQLEQQATMQYEELKQQARQKGALAPPTPTRS